MCGFPLTENEIFRLKKAAFCPHPFGEVFFLQREEIFFYRALDACAIGENQHEHSPQCREISKFITLPNSLERLKGIQCTYLFVMFGLHVLAAAGADCLATIAGQEKPRVLSTSLLLLIVRTSAR